MVDLVTLKLRGAPLSPDRLPRAFEGSQRSAANSQDDPFLPRGLLKVTAGDGWVSTLATYLGKAE